MSWPGSRDGNCWRVVALKAGLDGTVRTTTERSASGDVAINHALLASTDEARSICSSKADDELPAAGLFFDCQPRHDGPGSRGPTVRIADDGLRQTDIPTSPARPSYAYASPTLLPDNAMLFATRVAAQPRHHALMCCQPRSAPGWRLWYSVHVLT